MINDLEGKTNVTGGKPDVPAENIPKQEDGSCSIL